LLTHGAREEEPKGERGSMWGKEVVQKRPKKTQRGNLFPYISTDS